MSITLIAIFVLSASLYAGTAAENFTRKPDSWYRSDEGRKTMECILSWQSEQGDWPKNADTTSIEFSGDRSKLKGTFDNGATTGELRVLARAFRVTGDVRSENAFLHGFDHILISRKSVANAGAATPGTATGVRMSPGRMPSGRIAEYSGSPRKMDHVKDLRKTHTVSCRLLRRCRGPDAKNFFLRDFAAWLLRCQSPARKPSNLN